MGAFVLVYLLALLRGAFAAPTCINNNWCDWSGTWSSAECDRNKGSIDCNSNANSGNHGGQYAQENGSPFVCDTVCTFPTGIFGCWSSYEKFKKQCRHVLCRAGYSGNTCTTPAQCGTITAPVRGTVSASCTTYQCVATFGCNSGFTLSSASATRTCNAAGSWGSLPTCNDVNECQTLSNACGSDVTATCTNNQGGYSCTCKVGYYKDPSNSYRCLPKDCGAPPAIQNGAWTCSSGSRTCAAEDWKYAVDNPTLVCSSGYDAVRAGAVSPGRITCASDGQWDITPSSFSCRGVQCSAVDSIVNGQVTKNGVGDNEFRFPNSITVGCDPGYEIEQDGVRQVGLFSQASMCASTQSWSPSVARCISVECAVRDVVAHSMVFSGGTADNRYGTFVDYQCDAGFELDPPGTTHRSTCQTDGSWFPSAPACPGRNCSFDGGQPPNTDVIQGQSEYVYTEDSGNNPATTITLRCADTYYSEGFTDFSLTCQSDGFFDLVPSVCHKRTIVSVQYTAPASTSVVSQLVIEGVFHTVPDAILVNDISVDFGNTATPSLFDCASSSMTTGTTEDANGVMDTITCDLEAGYGANLTLALNFDFFGESLTVLLNDAIDYAKPVFTAETIHGTSYDGAGHVTGVIAPEVGPPPHHRFDSISTFGRDVITITGANFGLTPSAVVAIFADPSNPDVYTFPCAIDNAQTNDNQIVCETTYGTGGPFPMQVTVGNQISDFSADTFKYSPGPDIQDVNGCDAVLDATVYGKTLGCPTKGSVAGAEVVLTLTGTDFRQDGPPVITVGGLPCPEVPGYPDATDIVRCYLPPGAGLASVTITSGEVGSRPSPAVQYLKPTILNITGCERLKNCKRVGGELITITGNNFGPSRATVLISGTKCEPVLHAASMPHEQVTCALPSMEGLDQTVTILQFNGQIDFAPPELTVSYEECPPGTLEDAAGLACVDCPPGRYSVKFSSGECLPCAVGRFQPLSKRSDCRKAEPGHFVAEPASEDQTPCLVGHYSSSYQSETCVSCSPGTYADKNASKLCSACPEGKFTSGNGAHICQDCPLGKYSGRKGAPACDACPSGRVSLGEGALICSVCLLGQFDSSPSTCENCPAGRVGTPDAHCIPCAPGRVMPNNGSSFCRACLPGQYQPLGEMKHCLSCQPGEFQDRFASLDPIACGKGTANNKTEQSSCAPCPIGRHASGTGQRECVDCPPGTFSTIEGAQVCIACPKGFYGNGSAQLECVECPAGFKSSALGSTECSACELGFYSLSGAPDCTPCARGKYGRFDGGVNGTATCVDCAPGWFAPLTGATDCQACPAGQRSTREDGGSTGCLLCDAGTHQPDSEMTTCENCPAGMFASGEGNVMCTNCSVGRFSPDPKFAACLECGPGRYQREPGLASCIACDEGKFHFSTGAKACIDCPAGTFQTKTGSSLCDDCSPGTYTPSNATGMTFCFECDAGRYSEVARAKECPFCSPGHFSAGGSPRCSPCPAQSANPYPGMADCFACDRFSTQNHNGTECTCRKGFYAKRRRRFLGTKEINGSRVDQWELPSLNTTFACLPCIRGMECSEEGSTFESLKTAPGFWRPDTESTDYFRCILPVHCLGGYESTCGINRQGPICGLCKPNHAASGSGNHGECEVCEDNMAGAWVAAVFSVLGAGVGLFLMYFMVLTNDRQGLRRFKAEQMERQVSTQNSSGSDIDTSASMYDNTITTETIDWGEVAFSSRGPELTDQLKKGKIPIPDQGSRAAPNITYKLKIMLGWLQINYNLAIALDAPWPSYFVDFIQFFSFVNFDFMPWGSLGCIADPDFYQKMMIVGLTPLGVFIMLLVGYVIPTIVRDSRDMADDDACRMRRERSRIKFGKLTLFTLFLMYPFVSAVMCRYFVCRLVTGTWYLQADISVICFQDRWISMLPFAVIMCLIYPIGIPVTFFALLFKARADLQSPGVRVRLGFLYDAYSASAWWFEMCDIVNKLFLVAMVGFFPQLMQLPVAQAWTGAYIIVLLLAQPYVRKGDDRLHLFVMVYTLIPQMCAYTVMNVSYWDETLDILLSAVLILLFTIGFTLGAIMIARNLWKMMHRKQYEDSKVGRALKKVLSRKKKGAAPSPRESASVSSLKAVDDGAGQPLDYGMDDANDGSPGDAAASFGFDNSAADPFTAQDESFNGGPPPLPSGEAPE